MTPMAANMPKFITIDEALELINSSWGRPMYKRQTIYQKVWLGQLDRYGHRNRVLLRKDQVLKKLCAPPTR